MRRLGFLFLGLCAMTFAPQAQADLWISGHGDIGAHFHNGNTNAFELHFHFEDGAEGASAPIGAGEFEPDAFQIAVPGPPTLRPAGNQWNFLGVPENAPIWYLPQGIDPDKPYLGFGLDELLDAEWDGPLTWRLMGVNGPALAEFAMWKEAFGVVTPVIFTADGIGTNDSFTLEPGDHEHFFLGFTSEGIFDIEFEVSGLHLTGLKSARGTFTFISGVPEPSSMALLSCAGIGMAAGWVRRIRKAKSAT